MSAMYGTSRGAGKGIVLSMTENNFENSITWHEDENGNAVLDSWRELVKLHDFMTNCRLDQIRLMPAKKDEDKDWG